jgi:hypothetical protein
MAAPELTVQLTFNYTFSRQGNVCMARTRNPGGTCTPSVPTFEVCGAQDSNVHATDKSKTKLSLSL